MLFPYALTRRLLLSVAFLLPPCASQAAERTGIYLLLNDSAVIHLTDRPSGDARALVNALPPAAAEPLATPYRKPFAAVALDAIVRQAAQAHALDPNLLHAVIAAESGYLGAAVSRRGAQGLMQLMPATARSLGVTNAFDAKQNISAGARHLRSLMNTFGQDTRLALAAYNAGAAAVERHGRRIPPFAETEAYVPRVLNHLAALQTASASPHDPRPN